MSEKRPRAVVWLSILCVILVGTVGVQAYRLGLLQEKIAAANVEIMPGGDVKARGQYDRLSRAPIMGGGIEMLGPGEKSGLDTSWDPKGELTRIREHVNQLFSDAFSRYEGSPDVAFVPRLDLRDEGDRYVVIMDLPGMDKAGINIEVRDRVVTVSGLRKEFQTEEKGEVVRREQRIGKFMRSFMLPHDIKPDAVEAQYDNGVLRITVPKAQVPTEEPMKVTIK